MWFLLIFAAKLVYSEEERQVLESMDDWKGTPSVSGSYSVPKNEVATTAIKSLEDWDTMMANEFTMVIGFFDDWQEGNAQRFLQTAIKRATDEFIEYRFAHCMFDEKVKEYGDASIIMFRPAAMSSKYDENIVRYDNDGKWTVNGISKWIKDNFFGKCPIATNVNFNTLPRPLAIAYINVDFVNNKEQTQLFRVALMDAANSVDNKINVAVANPTTFEHLYPILSDVEVNKERPFVIIYDKNNKQTVMKMKYKGGIEGFFADYINPKGAEQDSSEGNTAEETDQGVKDEL